MARNLADLQIANHIGADNYFHCKANYQAARRGNFETAAGKVISFKQELHGVRKGEYEESIKDWVANQAG